MAESKEIIREVAAFMAPLAEDLKFDWVFKASFDKANRTSIHSERGPGWEKASDWFLSIKEEFDCPVLTDIHETEQVPAVAEVCEFLQIPAFLCRQTDLLEAAVASGRQVNVKKGQFLAPQDTGHIVGKAKEIAKLNGLDFNLGLTERGTTFGYGNLVVDMRSFPIMAKTGAAVIFDVTHSLQLPSAAGGVSGGMREFAPHLARAAAATGCLDGFFIEVHPNPKVAKSDGATQLNFAQAKKLLSDVIGIWYQYQGVTEGDDIFMD
ncbi:MAG: 3-deoxy-8-phosphooctulonate synthase [Pseudobacteriovorax sp.]|nr:3-deoxy-8-phosphooctulonate synthase [Pseudobacteriovorax sp.]